MRIPARGRAAVTAAATLSTVALTITLAPAGPAGAAPTAGLRSPTSPAVTTGAGAPTNAGAPTAGRVVPVSPGKGTLQAAVSAAHPGDVLSLHAGTYTGRVFMTTSGTEAAPIVIQPFGDGPVTVTQPFEAADCAATQPNVNRTFMMREGVDWWTIQDLTIEGGVWVSGTNFSAPAFWVKDQTKRLQNWEKRRSLPGRGYVNGQTAVPDRAAASGIYRALTQTLGVEIEPATGIKLLRNDISGRGIHVAVGTRGVISHNNVHDIDCGIGPGIWLNTYSDFWEITHNTVARVENSTWLHYMQEGIRTGSASSYNTIAHNTVTDLPTDGRGITTDIDASFNVFEFNTVKNVALGLNDQESGWGNIWRSNLVTGVRGPAMVFRGADAKLKRPSLNSSSLKAVVECNVASAGSLSAGALMGSTFTNNAFKRVSLSKNLMTYWTEFRNTWNGSTKLPPGSPQPPKPGVCPPAGA